MKDIEEDKVVELLNSFSSTYREYKKKAKTKRPIVRGSCYFIAQTKQNTFAVFTTIDKVDVLVDGWYNNFEVAQKKKQRLEMLNCSY